MSENTSFLAGDGAHRLVLRVHRPGYHGADEIRSELAWIGAILEAGLVTTAAPYPARGGRETVSFAVGGNGTHPGMRQATAFAFVAGSPPADARDRAALFTSLGGIAAKLHRHARGWRRPDWFVRRRWDLDAVLGRDAAWGDVRAVPGLDDGDRRIIDAAIARVGRATAALGTGDDAFGLIHGDMRAANLLVDGDRIAVIDFDDCGFGWWGADFAASVSFLEDDPAIPELAASWLAGYRRIAPFPEAQARLLPDLVTMRRLQLTAWAHSRAGSDMAASLDPDFSRTTVRLAAAYLGR